MNDHPLTCEVRYTLDRTKLKEFEAYARAWIVLIERHGGTHHGYFLPRPAPKDASISFSGVGREGPADVAIALFSFPDEESYLRYRKAVQKDPECGPAADLFRKTRCFFSYERVFLTRMELEA